MNSGEEKEEEKKKKGVCATQIIKQIL